MDRCHGTRRSWRPYPVERRLVAALWLGWWMVLAGPPTAWAQRMDAFEGGTVRWQLVDSDCQAQLVAHEISLIMPHGGSSCELCEIVCGQGTMALLAYPIEPCRVLDEFRPALWTRCSSGRIQLGVRLVFPMAQHPLTNSRLQTILWGDMYSAPGNWQMLEVAELQKKLTVEMVNLRQRFGSELNLEGAYIDCLVLNAYTGPGRYRFQIDDLNLRGLVSLAATGQPQPANWRERWQWRQEVPQVPDQRLWNAGNRPTTWLHYHQESLPWIKSLGFTGVMLSELPSTQQLGLIAGADLGAILPVPPHNVSFDGAGGAAIHGWSVGSALDARQADMARQAAARVAQMPSELRRPAFGEALEQYWLFTRIADEIIVPFPAASTAGTTRDKLQWVARQLETTSKRGTGWVSLAVGPTPTLVDQVRVAHQVIAPDEPWDDSLANPLGLRYQVASAVMAGARGFVFRPFGPLESTHAPGSGEAAKLAALRWIHSDLAVWGPWIMGGQPVAPPELGRSDYQAASWTASQSRLVLALATPEDAQYCLPSTAAQPLELSLASPSSPQQVLRVTDGRLERVDAELTPAGIRWRVEQPQPIESFVVTANPLVIDFVRAQLSRQAEQRAADQLEIVSYNSSLAAQMLGARFATAPGQGTAVSGGPMQQLAQAQAWLDRGYQALHTRQPTAAIGLAARASESVQGLLFEAQQVAKRNLAVPQSSPFVVSPVALGYHWRLADACQRSQWRELSLPGAQLLSPPEMEALGWSLEQRPLEQVDLQVEFLPPQPERPSGLRLAAYASHPVSTPSPQSQATARMTAAPLPGGYEGASSRVRSAAAAVQAGQLVRVAATARILRPPTTADSGILIYDNQAGPSLGQLVQGAAGEVVSIELYRFIVADGEFRILVECRGECDVVLETLSTSVIEPAVNRQSYETTRATP